MSHRVPVAQFARSRLLSRRGDLRLCRSIPIGSIAAGNAAGRGRPVSKVRDQIRLPVLRLRRLFLANDRRPR
jgi:hypothetical protein